MCPSTAIGDCNGVHSTCHLVPFTQSLSLGSNNIGEFVLLLIELFNFAILIFFNFVLFIFSNLPPILCLKGFIAVELIIIGFGCATRNPLWSSRRNDYLFFTAVLRPRAFVFILVEFGWFLSSSGSSQASAVINGLLKITPRSKMSRRIATKERQKMNCNSYDVLTNAAALRVLILNIQWYWLLTLTFFLTMGEVFK